MDSDTHQGDTLPHDAPCNILVSPCGVVAALPQGDAGVQGIGDVPVLRYHAQQRQTRCVHGVVDGGVKASQQLLLHPAHHQMICDLYRRRRDVMLQSIDRYFPAGTKHSNPDGGLFTWVELPGGIDTSALLQESSTDPAVNVAFVAGEGFFSDRDGQGKNCMRMSFGNTPEDLIEEGVRRLGGLICSKLNK